MLTMPRVHLRCRMQQLLAIGEGVESRNDPTRVLARERSASAVIQAAIVSRTRAGADGRDVGQRRTGPRRENRPRVFTAHATQSCTTWRRRRGERGGFGNRDQGFVIAQSLDQMSEWSHGFIQAISMDRNDAMFLLLVKRAAFLRSRSVGGKSSMPC